MPWGRVFQGVEDRSLVGAEGGWDRGDHAVDFDGGRAQGFEGAQDSSEGESGPVLDLSADREGGVKRPRFLSAFL